jgi:hypothetical protein
LVLSVWRLKFGFAQRPPGFWMRVPIRTAPAAGQTPNAKRQTPNSKRAILLPKSGLQISVGDFMGFKIYASVVRGRLLKTT